MNKISLFLMSIVFGFSTSACSTKAGMSNVMKQQAVASKVQADLKLRLANDWDQGSRLLEQGNELIDQGNKRIKAGQKEISRGENDVIRGKEKVTQGRALMERSEREFMERFPQV
ncbi:hypothetical protein OB934_23170 [Aeromonas salmonicida]|uniref:hypothetical protein n=1 Tax=Aeromonas salmonicida TaxID=645 RepID=UPI00259EAAD1|nr:hypothetical protein [Aeromonas salmonicida]MDM5065655.1 hypothetical protein [Aeromonas salmonicida]